MKDTTRKIIKTAIQGDGTLSPREQEAIQEAIIETLAQSGEHREPIPRIITRGETARILGKSRARVSQLAKAGLLKKVYGIGNQKALGFTEESVRALTCGIGGNVPESAKEGGC